MNSTPASPNACRTSTKSSLYSGRSFTSASYDAPWHVRTLIRGERPPRARPGVERHAPEHVDALLRRPLSHQHGVVLVGQGRHRSGPISATSSTLCPTVVHGARHTRSSKDHRPRPRSTARCLFFDDAAAERETRGAHAGTTPSRASRVRVSGARRRRSLRDRRVRRRRRVGAGLRGCYTPTLRTQPFAAKAPRVTSSASSSRRRRSQRGKKQAASPHLESLHGGCG